uniref:Ammonium transporter AmtB-like domain-containing protein n=1 Tax=Gorilla gorilla gorilla TaxID=9595 RepID=G3RLV0_GORGO
MSSKYLRSVRCCLPLCALTLEAALILLFYFFTHYDASLEDQKGLVASYQGESSLEQWSQEQIAGAGAGEAYGSPGAQIRSLTLSSRLEYSGAISARCNLSLLEDADTHCSYWVLFQTDYHMNMIHIYVFAAYFGVTVAWCLPKPLPDIKKDKDQIATIPSLSAMLGTLFLWTFWPSFNSALLRSPIERKNAVFNTYYALAVSVVTAISGSSLAHPQGKINMVSRALPLGSTWRGLGEGMLAGGAVPDWLPGPPRHWGTQLGHRDSCRVWSPDRSVTSCG